MRRFRWERVTVRTVARSIVSDRALMRSSDEKTVQVDKKRRRPYYHAIVHSFTNQRERW